MGVGVEFFERGNQECVFALGVFGADEVFGNVEQGGDGFGLHDLSQEHFDGLLFGFAGGPTPAEGLSLKVFGFRLSFWVLSGAPF